MHTPKNTLLLFLFAFITLTPFIYGQQLTEAQQVLALVNQVRAENGLNQVFLNDELSLSAQRHSKDMNDNNYFSHTGLNGSTFSQRTTAAGYDGFAQSENIANGQRDANQVYNSWINSDGHRRNILNSSSNEMGLAHVGSYWTQIFGRTNRVLSVTDNFIQNGNTTVSIYPNPTTGNIGINNINSNSNIITISLIDLSGRVVFEKQIRNSTKNPTINISHLASGGYFLKLSTTKKLFKVIKV